MSAPNPVWRGRPDETGFLLLPLAALVFSSAVLLAVVFGLTVLARPGCGLGDVLDHPCSEMFVRMSNFFNLLAVPGVVLFAWQTRRQRRHTRPLEPGRFRAAEAVIAEVLASVTLRRPTPVLLGTRLGRRAFTGGTGDRPYVALGPELLATAAKGPEGRAVFEAVLRHELAHVQNHDLLRLRFATVLRISTRATALGTGLLLLALLIWVPGSPTAGETLGVLVRATVLAVLAELTTRAFLRLREHQADVRAAGGDPDGIRVALHQGPEAPRG
ncbi:M48 family metalloprotease, partial [Micromonospora purpureochromogenes]|uniref:M48 family metalloprotease n=1 Tax=Micromonospora purpureochromogenes TaxID=47872 RepID=UPI0033D7D305